jgi:hypothetical protein
MNILETIAEAAPILESRVRTIGADNAYRESVLEMASNGGMGLLRLVLDGAAKQYAQVILSDATDREITLARGGLLALRGIWQDMIQLGSGPEDPHPLPYEADEFAILSDVDS